MEPKLENGAKNKTKNKKSVDMQHFFQCGERVRERILSSCLEWHCVKNARIQSYSGPNTGRCGPEQLRIWDTFYAVYISRVTWFMQI